MQRNQLCASRYEGNDLHESVVEIGRNQLSGLLMEVQRPGAYMGIDDRYSWTQFRRGKYINSNKDACGGVKRNQKSTEYKCLPSAIS